MSTVMTRGLLNWKSSTQASSLSSTLTRGGAGMTLYPPPGAWAVAAADPIRRASGTAANQRRDMRRFLDERQAGSLTIPAGIAVRQGRPIHHGGTEGTEKDQYLILFVLLPVFHSPCPPCLRG